MLCLAHIRNLKQNLPIIEEKSDDRKLIVMNA